MSVTFIFLCVMCIDPNNPRQVTRMNEEIVLVVGDFMSLSCISTNPMWFFEGRVIPRVFLQPVYSMVEVQKVNSNQAGEYWCREIVDGTERIKRILVHVGGEFG